MKSNNNIRSGVRGRDFRYIKPQVQVQVPKMEVPWQNPLSSQQKQYILSRFPTQNIKLSYETVAPKKVLSTEEYDLCVAIPYGKKAYLWYSFCNEFSVCLLLELNRDNQLNDNISIFPTSRIPKDFELGTIISGTIYEDNNELLEPELEIKDTTKKIFIVDDIHMYKGITISTKPFSFKSGFLYDFFLQSYSDSKITLAVLWNNNNSSSTNEKKYDNIPYNFRHIQYRSTNQILPHYNVSNIKKFLFTNNENIMESVPVVLEKERKKYIINTNWKFDFSKPIYKQNVYFWIKADLAYDVYYLGTRKQKEIIYCQNALVLNFKTSVLLNTIFRKIKENQCLDMIEDSDDEMDFEDVREDKLVDLNKECIMECYFHLKFKKWIPLCLVSTDEYKSKVVQLQSLL
jgi:hypothetical protein